MRRLRSLSETECYVRLYGGWDSTVTLVKVEPRRPRYELSVSGEDLRRDFEARIEGDIATFLLAIFGTFITSPYDSQQLELALQDNPNEAPSLTAYQQMRSEFHRTRGVTLGV